MKIPATSVALTTATAMMIVAAMRLSSWKSWLTTNDRAVQTHRATKMIKYALKLGPAVSWACSSVMGDSRYQDPRQSWRGLGSNLHQVQQREQEDPDDIDKVPIKTDQLNGELVVRAKLAQHVRDQLDAEDNEAAEHMDRVEAGHGEVARCPQVPVRDGKGQMRIRIDFEDALDERGIGGLALFGQIAIERTFRLHIGGTGVLFLHPQGAEDAFVYFLRVEVA